MAIAALLLGLINIGSSTAFNAMTSMALIGHYTSYLMPIGLLLIRRLGNKHVPWGPFRLGRWGLLVNLFSVFYSALLIVFMVFPPYQPVTARNMNYASAVFGFVMLLSFILWFMYGKKVYRGPVREVIEDMHIK